MADWNEDGVPDLLVGDLSGNITLFVNTGTPTEPALKNWGMLEAMGRTLDVGQHADPEVVDWNKDGKKDLVVGMHTGLIILFLNVNTNDHPVFNSQTMVPVGSYIIRHPYSSPVVRDLDSDGMDDLLVGDHTGQVYYYRNVGIESTPEFTESVGLQTVSGELKVAARTRIDMSDWDNDGDQDLIVSDDSAHICLFLNTTISSGHKEKPVHFSASILFPNFPNPFNGRTDIRYELAEHGPVLLDIYDTWGRRVRSLVDGVQPAGLHHVSWNGNDDTGRKVSSGLYIYRLKAGTIVQAKKMIYQK